MNRSVKHVIPAAAALCLLASGCVMPDQISQIQKDIADVRQELNRIAREQAEVKSSVDQVQAQVNADTDRVTRADIADLESQVRGVSRDMDASREQMNDVNRRMDRLSQDLSQTRDRVRSEPLPETTPSGSDSVGSFLSSGSGAGGTARPDAVNLYNTAYADFSKGNYALAISGFAEYHQTFPDNGLADNAMYWIGECYFSQGDFDAAIQAFDRMLSAYPGSDKEAAAHLKKALAYQDQNQIQKAVIQFQYVVKTYPNSDESRIARDRLAGLGRPV